jgi:hypothetical protein
MARSAAQSAARRRKRQQLPIFPLTQLPLELQLLVLGKCDLPSLRRLLRISARLRNLFLLYPDTCLSASLQQMPAETRNYLEASWALHNTDYEHFDATAVLACLQANHSFDDFCTDIQTSIWNGDALETLGSLADLYEEIETAAEPCAQGFSAVMESINHPSTRLTPVALSSTEHLRFVGALWILRIHYQLYLKFSHHGKEPRFRQLFVASLHAWQLHRVASLETLLARLLEDNPAKLRCFVGNSDVSWANLFEKLTYFRNYLQAAGWLATSFETRPILFKDTARGRGTAITANSSASWRLLSPDDEFTAHRPLSSEEPQYQSFGWLYFEYAMSWFPPSATRSLFFSQTGFLYWDRSRLSAWGMSDPFDLEIIVEAFTALRFRECSLLEESRPQWETKKAESIAQ